MKTFERFGDIANAESFENYLKKLYEWKEANGLWELIGEIDHVTVNVAEEDREPYIEELSLMTPYDYKGTYEDQTYLYSVLEVSRENPGYIIRARKDGKQDDVIEHMNMLSTVGSKKRHTRFIGETFRVKNLSEVQGIYRSAKTNFKQSEVESNPGSKYLCTKPSQYTWNTVGYIEYESDERTYHISGHAKKVNDTPAFLGRLERIKQLQFQLVGNKILPIDHLATRVFAQDRENALLQLVKLTSYYYWGSYDIADQNSSTNVTRNSAGLPEYQSPAKVFTAAHTPYFLDFIVNKPSPTESFVWNYGRRMHHIAYSVADDEPGQNVENIDHVVSQLKEHGVDFLLMVIGSKPEGLKQIFSRASKYSYLITEYIQRYNGFQGFFTKKNVAFLTEAAGHDENLRVEMGEKNLCD